MLAEIFLTRLQNLVRQPGSTQLERSRRATRALSPSSCRASNLVC